MIVGILIVSLLVSFALALLFEMAYGTIAQTYKSQMTKANLSRLYFCVIGILWCLNPNVLWIVQLPILFGVGISHSDLCQQPSKKITWREILRNIVPATKAALRKLSS